MKQIKDLTDQNIDRIISILLGKSFEESIIQRTPENDFIIAEYKRSRSIDPKYDTIEMVITIDKDFNIRHNWNYIKSGSIGVTNEPLYNYQLIAKYLLDEGFDIYRQD